MLVGAGAHCRAATPALRLTALATALRTGDTRLPMPPPRPSRKKTRQPAASDGLSRHSPASRNQKKKKKTAGVNHSSGCVSDGNMELSEYEAEDIERMQRQRRLAMDATSDSEMPVATAAVATTPKTSSKAGHKATGSSSKQRSSSTSSKQQYLSTAPQVSTATGSSNAQASRQQQTYESYNVPQARTNVHTQGNGAPDNRPFYSNHQHQTSANNAGVVLGTAAMSHRPRTRSQPQDRHASEFSYPSAYEAVAAQYAGSPGSHRIMEVFGPATGQMENHPSAGSLSSLTRPRSNSATDVRQPGGYRYNAPSTQQQQQQQQQQHHAEAQQAPSTFHPHRNLERSDAPFDRNNFQRWSLRNAPSAAAAAASAAAAAAAAHQAQHDSGHLNARGSWRQSSLQYGHQGSKMNGGRGGGGGGSDQQSGNNRSTTLTVV
eukprot:scpid28502/ scgid12831/ 